MLGNSMDSLNAKKMTADQVARTFVVPPSFDQLSSQDHVFVIGPRGSGKTTLLRMLTGESLIAWEGREADAARQRIRFSSVFVPADELWASQTSVVNVRAAFAAQLLLALVSTMTHRTTRNRRVHLPARLSPEAEANLVEHLSRLWGLERVVGGFAGLQSSLELFLAEMPSRDHSAHPMSNQDTLRLVVPAVEAFNRAVDQVGHPWAILLDEMELAPTEVHRMVTAFVRGGAPILTLKISMSPFDRFMDFYGDQPRPISGHDYQTIYLSGQETRDLRRFTFGLWSEALRSRGLPIQPLVSVLSAGENSRRERTDKENSGVALVASMAQRDSALREWLRRREVNLQDPRSMSYFERSATIRKISPLLVYRDTLLNFRDGSPVRRSRKKSFEPFTGANAVVTILEGNPRWIKSAFAQMLERYDQRTGKVSQGFQYDALLGVATRFESLLRVLPIRQGAGDAVPPLQLVDDIAKYLRMRNLSSFSADAPNSFIVDRRATEEVHRGLLLALYAGAVVHLRDRQSPAVLSSFTNERFRLTHLLSIRDGKELPLRLGKDVNLSSILAPKPKSVPAAELPIDWSSIASS